MKKICLPLWLILSWRRQTKSPMIKVLTEKNKCLSLTKKKKRLSQKLVALKKINHPLLPLKIRVTKSTHILLP